MAKLAYLARLMQFPRVDLTHRGTRIGVAGGDLHVARVNPGVKHGRGERMAQHRRMWLGYRHCGGLGQPP
jgi:hypothetical protein